MIIHRISTSHRYKDVSFRPTNIKRFQHCKVVRHLKAALSYLRQISQVAVNQEAGHMYELVQPDNLYSSLHLKSAH